MKMVEEKSNESGFKKLPRDKIEPTPESDMRTAFVVNLPFNLTESHLEELFSQVI